MLRWEAPSCRVRQRPASHPADITAALDEAGLLNNSVAVKNCGLPDQQVITDINSLKSSPPNYWTLVLAKQKKFDAPEES